MPPRRKRLLVSADCITDGRALLSGDDRHHVARVLRLEPGAELVLLDGEGGRYDGVIDAIDARTVHVAIRQRQQQAADPPPRLTLIFGLAKGTRTELVLQKGTELGVGALVPAVCQRSVVRPREPVHKQQRWREVVRQAARQSGRAWLPTVAPPTALPAALAEHGSAALRLIAVPGAGLPATHFAPLLARQPAEVAMAIGPEGGFTDQELEMAHAAGFQPLSLGPHTLRAETAALAALALIGGLAGRLDPPA